MADRREAGLVLSGVLDDIRREERQATEEMEEELYHLRIVQAKDYYMQNHGKSGVGFKLVAKKFKVGQGVLQELYYQFLEEFDDEDSDGE